MLILFIMLESQLNTDIRTLHSNSEYYYRAPPFIPPRRAGGRRWIFIVPAERGGGVGFLLSPQSGGEALDFYCPRKAGGRRWIFIVPENRGETLFFTIPGVVKNQESEIRNHNFIPPVSSLADTIFTGTAVKRQSELRRFLAE